MNSPIQELLESDKRFKLEAYKFVREALLFAHENLELGKSESVENDESNPPRHVTGQQLCEACRLYAIEQYGYLAKMVLSKWGVHSTSDFGELVYNLIRIEQMRKSDTDRREDFDDVFSFDDAFEPEFEFASRDDD